MVAGSIIAGVLGLLALSGAVQVLSPAYRGQVGEAVGAVGAVRRAGAAPVAVSGVGVGAAPAARVPTLILPPCCGQGGVAEQIPGTGGSALVDGVVGPTAPVWRSPQGFTTADLRLRVRDSAPAARVLFAQSTAAAPETWAKEVEVWISLNPDGADAIRVGQWTLVPTTDAQAFPFAPAPVASVRLRILSNYGSAEYTSLAEFAVLPASG